MLFRDCGSKASISAASWRGLDIRGQPLEVPGAHLEAPQRHRSRIRVPPPAARADQSRVHTSSRCGQRGRPTRDGCRAICARSANAELPIGRNAGRAHTEKHACNGRICVDEVPRDEKHGMRERPGLLDRQPRSQELRRASRFAFEGHLAPASKVDKVRIREEHAAPGGSLALIGREPATRARSDHPGEIRALSDRAHSVSASRSWPLTAETALSTPVSTARSKPRQALPSARCGVGLIGEVCMIFVGFRRRRLIHVRIMVHLNALYQ